MTSMGLNFIVLRNSPDWRHFDVASSVAFCRRWNLPENTIIDFVDIWDRTMKIDYRAFRTALKDIAFANHATVRNAQIISHEEARALRFEAGDLLAFTDDDDWFAPDLCDLPVDQHGCHWGSIRLGRGPNPSFNYDVDSILLFRPVDQVIWTNNYFVTGKAIAEVGFDAVFDHTNAQQVFSDTLKTRKIDRHASCTNKTPASAMSAYHLLALENFRENPLREFMRFGEALDTISLPDHEPWMRKPFDAFRRLMSEALYGH
jgi:hypothetical protein